MDGRIFTFNYSLTLLLFFFLSLYFFFIFCCIVERTSHLTKVVRDRAILIYMRMTVFKVKCIYCKMQKENLCNIVFREENDSRCVALFSQYKYHRRKIAYVMHFFLYLYIIILIITHI